jgi:hypothetical protein
MTRTYVRKEFKESKGKGKYQNIKHSCDEIFWGLLMKIKIIHTHTHIHYSEHFGPECKQLYEPDQTKTSEGFQSYLTKYLYHFAL